jgi:cellulose synthase/poly-beta-1,6-N-acetylglucosamine synthase-like glycosyltransferase
VSHKEADPVLTDAIVLGVTVVAAGLTLMSGYLLLLTIAASLARRKGPPDAMAARRFAILIPAHNEEALLGRLLDSLRQLDYPPDRATVHVVADNCEDRTADVARTHGANVHERFDRVDASKGFALRWLLQEIRGTGRTYDAFVVLDADSIVSENFLRRMDAYLDAGSLVVQAHYSVLNARETPVATLRYAALAAVHYLRPLGRSVLGLSCGLKGNGMCFAASVLEQFDWRWYTLAEDVEFHLALVAQGIRVHFCPEATVLADMPVTFEQATSQNARWERGRLQLARHHVPSLLIGGLRHGNWLRIDAAIEQLIPPLSVPVAVTLLSLVAGISLHSPLVSALAFGSLAAQVGYLIAALAFVRAPLDAYAALCYAPVYIVWKVGVYARALVSTRSLRWVRTARVIAKPEPGRVGHRITAPNVDSS